MSRWTEDEIAVVERMYPRYGTHVDEWPEKLDRTPDAVRGFAERNHIAYLGRNSLRLDEDEAETLCRAWRLMARKLGVTSYDLFRDVCVLQAMGRL